MPGRACVVSVSCRQIPDRISAFEDDAAIEGLNGLHALMDRQTARPWAVTQAGRRDWRSADPPRPPSSVDSVLAFQRHTVHADDPALCRALALAAAYPTEATRGVAGPAPGHVRPRSTGRPCVHAVQHPRQGFGPTCKAKVVGLNPAWGFRCECGGLWCGYAARSCWLRALCPGPFVGEGCGRAGCEPGAVVDSPVVVGVAIVVARRGGSRSVVADERWVSRI